MKFLLFLTLFFFSFSLSAQDIDCSSLAKETRKLIVDMKKYYKKNYDVIDEFAKYENNLKQLSNCPKYKNDPSLWFTDQEIAGFRKSIYAPDRSSNLSEDACTTIAVDTSNMPENRDQGETMWCFAYAPTDIISYYEKEKLSAYDVALQHHNDDEIRSHVNPKNKNLDFTKQPGWSQHAMAVAITGKGICLEKDTRFKDTNWYELSKLFITLSDPNKSLVEIICSENLQNSTPFKNLDQNVIKVIDKLSSDKKVSALLDVVCTKRHQIKNNYSMYYASTYSKKITSKELASELDKKLSTSEPAVIGYHLDVLNFGVNYKSENNNHFSTVIGRKFNRQTGQCEYQIRNSWGNEEVCTRTPSIRCENGNYWISRTALVNNLFTVLYLDLKK